MKIQAKNPKSVAGITLIVPVDGRISISADGSVEVSEVCAKALVEGTNDWAYAEKSAPEDNSQKEAPADQDGKEEAQPTERDKFCAEVKAMTVAQLKKLCVDGGLPEAEWKNLTKPLLIKYLVDKFDAASSEEEKEQPEAESVSTEESVAPKNEEAPAEESAKESEEEPDDEEEDDDEEEE